MYCSPERVCLSMIVCVCVRGGWVRGQVCFLSFLRVNGAKGEAWLREDVYRKKERKGKGSKGMIHKKVK